MNGSSSSHAGRVRSTTPFSCVAQCEIGWVVTMASRSVAATFAIVSLLVATGTNTVTVARSSSDLNATARQQDGFPAASTDPTMTETPGSTHLRSRSFMYRPCIVDNYELFRNFLGKFSDSSSEVLATRLPANL